MKYTLKDDTTVHFLKTTLSSLITGASNMSDSTKAARYERMTLPKNTVS